MAVENLDEDNGTPMAGMVTSDTFATLVKNQTSLILKSSDDGFVIDENFSFTSATCLIYSEKVVIKTNVKPILLPGKKLGIFCNTLEILGDGQAVLDVSGKKGVDGVAAPVGSGNDGKSTSSTTLSAGGNGEAGGKVWLFVHNSPSEATIKRLVINANGGKGGDGAFMTAPGAIGTKGGDGGAGGTISFYYGHKSHMTGNAVLDLLTQPWPQQATEIESLFEKSMTVTAHQKAVFTYHKNLANAMYILLASTEELIEKSAPGGIGNIYTLSQPAFTSLQGLREKLKTSLGSPFGPHAVPESGPDGLIELSRAMKTWLINGGSDSSLHSSIRLHTESSLLALTPPPSGVRPRFSQLGGTLNQMSKTLDNHVQDFELSIRRIFDYRGGAHGIGGQSQNGAGPQGMPGTPGVVGSLIKKLLFFDGTTDDLDVEQPYVFPDQCRMLLNKADAFYFTDNAAGRNSAAVLYQTLLDRLAFVPALRLAPDQIHQMTTTYEQMASTLKITIDPLNELFAIFDDAKTKMARLSIGHDIFGHTARWAPRLSFQFYAGAVNTLITQLKSLETLYNQYLVAVNTSNNATEKAKEGMRKNRDMLGKVKERINLISGDNGVMEACALKIAYVSPVLTEKRLKVLESMKEIERIIEQNNKFSVKTIINAIAALVSSNKVTAIPNTLKTLDSIWDDLNSIENISGQQIRKDYIIQQLAMAGDSLASFQTALSLNTDSTIQIDDPKALKLLATKEQIASLIRQFKEAIPKDWQQRIFGDLDSYIATALERNNAVIEYNSNLQVLAAALLDQATYQAQVEKFGDATLKYDPNLPAIALWLQKMRDDLCIDIMQRMSYEARAIGYWSLSTAALEYSRPGPLRNSDTLQDLHGTIRDLFETSLNVYAAQTSSSWPANVNVREVIFPLSETQVATLKTPTFSSTGERIYSVIFSIPKTFRVFSGKANIRLSQVRPWILNANVAEAHLGHRILKTRMVHMGEEEFLDSSAESHFFSHEPVSFDFVFDCKGVRTINDTSNDIVSSIQNIQSNYGYSGGGGGKPTETTIAAIGPLTTWKLEVLEKHHDGLDLSQVTGVMVEFWGGHQAMSRQARKRLGLEEE